MIDSDLNMRVEISISLLIKIRYYPRGIGGFPWESRGFSTGYFLERRVIVDSRGTTARRQNFSGM